MDAERTYMPSTMSAWSFDPQFTILSESASLQAAAMHVDSQLRAVMLSNWRWGLLDVTRWAAELASYDTVAELLSINNTINVATLVGACFFGLLTVYGCILTWRHQRWERQLERRRGVDTADDGLEAGTHSGGYCIGDLNPPSVGETAVERRSDDTDADSVKLARPSLAAGQGEHEPTGMDKAVHGDVENIHRHIGGSGASLHRVDDMYPGYWESLAESDDTTLAHANISQMVDTNDTRVAASVRRPSASDIVEAEI